MRGNKHYFTSRGYKLCGILSSMHAHNTPIVVICHGYGSSKDSRKYILLEQDLGEKSIASFRFDLSGHGESEGSNFNAYSGLDNLSDAIDYLCGLGYKMGRTGVIGSSMSGEIALRYATDNKIGALVLRSPDFERNSDAYYRASYLKCPTRLIMGSSSDDHVFSQIFLDKIDNRKKDVKFIEGADHDCKELRHEKKFAEYATEWFDENLNKK